MTNTAYGVNDPLAVKLWSRKLFQETIKECWISKFLGKDSNALVQIVDEAQKSAGDQITIGLRMLLKGAGIQGDVSLEGQEEALTTHHFAIKIDQLRHAVRSAGKMSEQRVPFEIREEARHGLQDWWTDRLDTCFFNQICGNTVATDSRFTGNQTVESTDAEHVVRADQIAADEKLTEKHFFTLDLIDKAVERAKTLSPMIRPVRINGENKYVMFLHPYQVTDLRIASDNNQWLEIQKAALAGGQISNNPIYTGALGEYNGVILHESVRVTDGVSTENEAVPFVKRAVLCGAQSAVLAFGQGYQPNKVNWIEESFDYENQLGVSAGMIFGLRKSKINHKDFATIVVPTFASAHQ